MLYTLEEEGVVVLPHPEVPEVLEVVEMVTVPLYTGFVNSSPAMQFEELARWMVCSHEIRPVTP